MPNIWQALTPDEFADLFYAGWSTAFRLELLQDYAAAVEAESVAAFQAGRPVPMDWHEPWLAMLRSAAVAGHTITRVRQVAEPWTTYTAYELQYPYRLSVRAGEDIRVLLDAAPAAPGHDFWLLDETVCRMGYTGPTWVSAEISSDPATVADYSRWADQAIATSMPLHQYLDHAATGRRTA